MKHFANTNQHTKASRLKFSSLIQTEFCHHRTHSYTLQIVLPKNETKNRCPCRVVYNESEDLDHTHITHTRTFHFSSSPQHPIQHNCSAFYSFDVFHISFVFLCNHVNVLSLSLSHAHTLSHFHFCSRAMLVGRGCVVAVRVFSIPATAIDARREFIFHASFSIL